MMNKFKSDTEKLIDIITHSLYGRKDVFLRELLSNSADACKQLQSFINMNKVQLQKAHESKILIDLNTEQNTITICDNGTGMNKEELEAKLGTLGASGKVQKFMQDMESNKDGKSKIQEEETFIGQFGLGFYSVFMVGNKVQVWSKKYDSEKAYLWESTGKEGYSIEESVEPFFPNENGYGFQVKIFLKDECKEYAEKTNIMMLIKKYSNYLPVPVCFLDELDNKENQINDVQAPWQKKDLTEEEYEKIYGNILQGMGEVYTCIHDSAEGSTIDYNYLVFLPKGDAGLQSFYDPNLTSLTKIFVNSVFIYDNNEIFPGYLRFIKAIVDAKDFALNISRDFLQDTSFFAELKRVLVRKVFKNLNNMLKKDQEDYYQNFWQYYGPIMKEGCWSDYMHQKDILNISLFKSVKQQKFITLNQYIDNMKEEQEFIYYMNVYRDMSEKNPKISEFINSNDYDVLLMKDPVDEMWINMTQQYNDKKFMSIKKQEDQKEDDSTDEEKVVGEKIMNVLKDEFSDVKFASFSSDKELTSLVDPKDSQIDINMARLMGRKDAKHVLKINRLHPITKSLMKSVESEEFDKVVKLIYVMAVCRETNMNGKEEWILDIQSLLEKSLGKMF